MLQKVRDRETERGREMCLCTSKSVRHKPQPLMHSDQEVGEYSSVCWNPHVLVVSSSKMSQRRHRYYATHSWLSEVAHQIQEGFSYIEKDKQRINVKENTQKWIFRRILWKQYIEQGKIKSVCMMQPSKTIGFFYLNEVSIFFKQLWTS